MCTTRRTHSGCGHRFRVVKGLVPDREETRGYSRHLAQPPLGVATGSLHPPRRGLVKASIQADISEGVGGTLLTGSKHSPTASEKGPRPALPTSPRVSLCWVCAPGALAPAFSRERRSGLPWVPSNPNPRASASAHS